MENQETEAPFITLTEDQIQGYMERVEELIEARRRSGVLLSTFDLLAGASVIFFLTNTQNKMAAKWVFAAMQPDHGGLPLGVLEKAQELNHKLSEAQDAIAYLETLEDAIDALTVANRKLAKRLVHATQVVAKAAQPRLEEK